MDRRWIAGLALLMAACGGGEATSATEGSGGATSGTVAMGSGGGGAGQGGTAGTGGFGGAGGSGAGGAGGQLPPGWRSALYPDDWTPAFVSPEGHRIHDFSYAGYHNGEAPIGTPVVATLFEVTAYGADASGQADSTAAVQAAIDAAEANGGGVVHFAAGDYRFDGTLSVSSSQIVLRGEGPTLSRLFFTQAQGMSYGGHITFGSNPSYDAPLPLAQDGAEYALEVFVEDASSLSPGDDVALGWVITPAFIAQHGMTGVWQAFNDSWQPFFFRDVVAVDTSVTPHRVTVDVPLRYPALVSDQASLRKMNGYLRECGVDGLGLGNAANWDAAWDQDQVHVLEMIGVVDSWVRDVESFDPPTGPTSGSGAEDHLQSSGLMIRFGKRVTVADTTLQRAQHKGGGGNGYLFELRQSGEVLFRDCDARQGRHNFIQNWGFGVSGCVWLRVDSREGEAWFNKNVPVGQLGYSEFHHSLAMANLIDDSRFDDGFSIVNRGDYSSGAGHTGTANMIWNSHGSGNIRSRQYGVGFVVGTRDGLTMLTNLVPPDAAGTEPEDWVEGVGMGEDLYPQSLYENQLAKRLNR